MEMLGNFIFVLFYGGVLILFGFFSRWMLSREKEVEINPSKTNTNEN